MTPDIHEDDLAQIDAEAPLANAFFEYFEEYGSNRALALLAGLIRFHEALDQEYRVKH